MAATIYSKFFWADWLSDTGVRASTYAARGLWMDLLCIAAHEKGFVKINDRSPDAEEIAKITGGTKQEVETLLRELEANGVFSRDRNGQIYCRRMVKYEKNRKNGQLGGNPMLLALQDNPFSDNHLPKAQRPLTTNHLPKKKESKSPAKCLLPETWNPSSRHVSFGRKLGLTEEQVNESASDMRYWSHGNGEMRPNWDAYFNTWLKNPLTGKRYGKAYVNGRYERNGPVTPKSAILDTLDRAIEERRSNRLRAIEGPGDDGLFPEGRGERSGEVPAGSGGDIIEFPKAGS